MAAVAVPRRSSSLAADRSGTGRQPWLPSEREIAAMKRQQYWMHRQLSQSRTRSTDYSGSNNNYYNHHRHNSLGTGDCTPLPSRHQSIASAVSASTSSPSSLSSSRPPWQEELTPDYAVLLWYAVLAVMGLVVVGVLVAVLTHGGDTMPCSCQLPSQGRKYHQIGREASYGAEPARQTPPLLP